MCTCTTAEPEQPNAEMILKSAASLQARQEEQSCEATLVGGGCGGLRSPSSPRVLEFVGKMADGLQLRPWTIVAELCEKTKKAHERHRESLWRSVSRGA